MTDEKIEKKPAPIVQSPAPLGADWALYHAESASHPQPAPRMRFGWAVTVVRP